MKAPRAALSRRGKRLAWAGIFCYLLLIYLTLPYAPALQRWLLRAWGDPAKQIGIIFSVLLGAAVLIYYLVRRKDHRLRVLISGVVLAALYVLAFKYLVLYPAEQFHFAEYGALSWMVFLVLIREQSLKKTIALVLLFGAAAGILDEVIQHFLPQRHFEWRDILVNLISSILGLAGVITIACEGKDRHG
jgi:uncharacterized membrane protein HdeD (DUF308 family)